MADTASWADEPGGARRLRARWVVTGTLTLTSAAHLGGGDGAAADLMVIRDRVEDRPLLTGASLAGALRAHLGDCRDGYGKPGRDDRIAALFGGGRGDDQGAQSALITFDALGTLPSARTEIRDGVRIVTATGTAADHQKYDLEVLPARTVFPLRLDLLVDEDATEDELLRSLLATLDGLAHGEIALGMRRSRGLGRLRAANWRVRRFDLGSPAGWLAWLTADPVSPLDGLASHPDPRAACRVALGVEPPTAGADQRRRAEATATLTVRGGLLVRSTASADAPDAVHMRSGGDSVLPGTSLAGALRSRAAKILSIVRPDDAVRWLTRLFGPHLEPGTKVRPHASRLRVTEAVIANAARLRQTRIRVDRATHGVAAGALFDEEPLVGGRIEVGLELREPREGEVGLMLLLLKDLLSGDLPLGGTAAVGRGVLDGTAVLTVDGSEVALRPGEAPQDERVDREIKALKGAEVLTDG